MANQELEDIKRKSTGIMQKNVELLKERLDKIQHKIGVYSGKGGVGKTTVAVNLAVALAEQGYSVGFLDADIDCPNAHIIFGINEKTAMSDGMLVPVERYGVKFVSMALLAENDEAIMWRGPMLTKAINDFLSLTDWGELDYLIIDMPPGTSDAPITIMQLLTDLDGFVVVTTPQLLATTDMNRSINMIKNLGKHVLGVVENMCGPVFGCSKNVNYIAHIPMEKEISESSDAGRPIVLQNNDIKNIFERIIEKIE